MAVFELVLALLLGGVGLALLAPRLGVPWPALLALAGAALAFVPGVPDVALDLELALALFVAPVLLDAAYDASPRDLRDNWVPVSGLVLGAAGLTMAALRRCAGRNASATTPSTSKRNWAGRRPRQTGRPLTSVSADAFTSADRCSNK